MVTALTRYLSNSADRLSIWPAGSHTSIVTNEPETFDMHFIALDFETANESMASICQVGIAEFEQGQLRDAWSTLIDPEDYFSSINVGIHGIDEAKVAGAPCFPDVYPDLAKRLSGGVVVSHTPFDRVALQQTVTRYQLPQLECQWLDSARVVRRTWPECA